MFVERLLFSVVSVHGLKLIGGIIVRAIGSIDSFSLTEVGIALLLWWEDTDRRIFKQRSIFVNE